jgi:hypothetical protein
MAVGFTTTYAISAYHHVSSNPAHDEVYSIQHNVIKIVSNLRQDGGIWGYSGFSSTNKTDHYAITEISLKVALNTITSPCPIVLLTDLCSMPSSGIVLLSYCFLDSVNFMLVTVNQKTKLHVHVWSYDNVMIIFHFHNSLCSLDNVMIIFHFHNSLCSLDNVMIIFQFHNSLCSLDNVMIIFHFHNSLCSLDNVMIIFQFHNSFPCLILYSFWFFSFFFFY